VVGVVDEVVRDFDYLYSAWEASAKLGAEAKRVLNLSKEEDGLLKKAQESSRIISAMDHVQSRLEHVSKIAAKFKNETRLKGFLTFGMARKILDDLRVIESQMGVVLQLLAAHDAAEIKSVLEERPLPLIRSNQTICTGTGTTHGDRWKNSFSSVPPRPSFVETRSICSLRQSLLNGEKPS
jgi:hypothetical protein